MRIAITGAAGNVAYALLPLIASGQVFGSAVPVELSLIEVPGKPFETLKGVAMELEDCDFPLVRALTITDDARVGFADVDVAILIGGAPHTHGMVRGDLLKSNAEIFVEQGRMLSEVARPGVHVVVVANPANTNALIAAENAPNLSADQFVALTRLDQNRATAYVAEKAGVAPTEVERVTVWGNHSASMVPDLCNALIAGKPALDVITDRKWVREEFIPKVQHRAEDLIRFRGKTSAFSAAVAIIDHLRDMFGGSGDAWRTIAVRSDGSFGIAPGIWYSVPCVCGNGRFERVHDIKICDEFTRDGMQKTCRELLAERDEAVKYAHSYVA
jgi:malate dehydrogenase